MSSLKTSSGSSSRTALKPGEDMRLNRFLASCGLGSRRKVEELIAAGQISVNGEVCTDLARRVDPEKDEVCHQGKGLKLPSEKVYLVLNKPRGYVVSHQDELQRSTIYELLPESASNLRYAGRLDKNSEGLLLLTNDGELINRLTHPTHKVEKVYRVDVDRRLSQRQLEELRRGVLIEGGITHSAGVYVKSETTGGMTLRLVITEGRKRQIRQMIEAVGAKVRLLRRLQFGPLKLKDLPSGRWRPLTTAELNALKYVTESNQR